MRPTLKFVSGKGKPTEQTENLRKWWNEHSKVVLEAIDYYVKRGWAFKSIEVRIERYSRRGSKAATYHYEGEVDVDHPEKICLLVGRRVRWTGSSLLVFIHELVHCATHSGKDRRRNRPGLFEFWVLDELATDLVAQYVLKDVTKAEPKIRNSIEYALTETANHIARNRELRNKLVRKVKKILKSYLGTEKKNFYSFRESLKNV